MDWGLSILAAAGFWLGALYVENKFGVRRPKEFPVSSRIPAWERFVLAHYTMIRAAGLVTMWLGAVLVATMRDTGASALMAIGFFTLLGGVLLYLVATVCALTRDPRNSRSA